MERERGTPAAGAAQIQRLSTAKRWGWRLTVLRTERPDIGLKRRLICRLMQRRLMLLWCVPEDA